MCNLKFAVNPEIILSTAEVIRLLNIHPSDFLYLLQIDFP